MTKTVAKTFRLPLEIAKEIESESKKSNISQAQYVTAIFTENKFLKHQKIFLENVKGIEGDAEYQKEQKELADADFL